MYLSDILLKYFLTFPSICDNLRVFSTNTPRYWQVSFSLSIQMVSWLGCSIFLLFLFFLYSLQALHISQFQILPSWNLKWRKDFDFWLYIHVTGTSRYALYQMVCPVGWGFRIHWLLLCNGVRPTPTSVLDITLNNLMVRFQWSWNFGECGTPLHCHCSQVHYGSER